MRATVGRLLGRALLGVVGLVIGAVLVSALREATLSTHQQVSPNSEVEVVVRARTHGGEQGQTLEEMVEAQLLTCRLEVASDIVAGAERRDGRIDEEDRGLYTVVLRPAMDQTNRRQFKGCVEDFVVDGLQMDVLTMRDIA